MSREILREKLYAMIQNIEDESTLTQISNFLDVIIKKADSIDFDTEDLDDFMERNKDILNKG
jgi:predicted house-cleaning noncanonical NTP pyrophosphatase (MazG superfamily)